jgi:tetraacyldisaccharide 4'-kinase
MRAPAGWWLDRADLLCRALQPMGALYGALTAARMKRTGTRADIPVICIGNFVAGGAGKTPTALAIGKMLQAQGELIAFLSRGYGGTLASATPVQVDPAHHRAAEVGDEPLLLARRAPTFICTDRVAGARAAAQAGASLVILDDGLQNPGLTKDMSLAVVDGEAGIGNGLCVPAGPLRAPLDAQWPFVDGIVIIGKGARGEVLAQQARTLGKLVLHGTLMPENAHEIHNKKLHAFAGIGRPEKFFAYLRDLGGLVTTTKAFADHHSYTADDLEKIRRLAGAKSQDPETIVTTEKDAIRIPEGALPGLVVLRVALTFDEHQKLADLIARKISRG